MTMPKALVIPADPDLPTRTETVDGLADYQRLTGGYIEAAPLDREDLTMFINEEGKVMNLDRNTRADDLWWTLLPSGRIPGDYIAGDAVVVGFDEETGEHVDVPDDVLACPAVQGSLPAQPSPAA